MYRAIVSLTAAIAILVPARSASAQTPRRVSTPHAKVELIADRDTIGSGGVVWVGIRFELEPHWHIYWQNPGDSGGPPEVVWTLPPGMSAGAIEWPAPERIDSDGLISYGYRGVAVLPVQMKAAGLVRASTPVQIGASLKWIVCKDMCLPGHAQLALRLPPGPEDRLMVPAWRMALKDARTLMPRPAPPNWRATALLHQTWFDVDVIAGETLATGVFFPFEPGQIDDTKPQEVSPIPGGLRFRLHRSAQLTKDPRALRGVVSLPGGRAFIVTVPVALPPGGKKGGAP